MGERLWVIGYGLWVRGYRLWVRAEEEEKCPRIAQMKKIGRKRIKYA
jgi:hypothetical protein